MFLKQSTPSQEVVIGPFLDEDDGKTAETGLSIGVSDVRLSKAGANIVAKNSGGGTHDELGFYQITLDATDTNTVGELLIAVHKSGALPVFKYCYVLEEAIYDALFAASASAFDSNARVDVVSIEGSDATDQINAACDAAIETYGLDHLVSASVAGSDVADNSIVAKLVSKESTADWDDFANTTDSLQALRDQTGSGLTAIPWNSSWDAEVQSECNDALVALGLDHMVSASVAGSDVADDSIIAKLVSKESTADWDDFVNTTDSLQALRDRGDASWITASPPTAASIADAVWDEATSGHTSSGTFGEQVKTDIDDILADTAEIGSAGAGLTAVPWNSSWDAEVQSECNDALVAMGLDHLVSASVSGSDVADNSIIAQLVSKESTADWDDFVNTTDSLQALRDRGDASWTTGGGGSAADIADAVWNEAAGDHTSSGSFGKYVADILTDTAVIGANGAGLSAIPWNSAWDTEVESECTDALNAYDPPTKTEMDGMWTTVQTESYASDGSEATPAQLLYMILCSVSEFSVSGTTITGKKLNGSDTAMTWTINHASNPSSRTRAS